MQGLFACDKAGCLKLGDQQGTQPDIETLEAIAGAFDTDILMVLYGRRQEEADAETRQAQRKQCIRNALLWGP